MKALAFLVITLAIAAPLFAGEVIAQTITIQEIRSQVSRFSDIGSFVEWLKEFRNISGVENQPILLTTDPPQQWVAFSIEGKRYRFRLTKELDVEVLRGSDKTVVKGKVVLVKEDGPTTK